MGEHRAQKLPRRGLRSSYTQLLQAYGRLLRDHRRLEAEHQGLLERVPPETLAGRDGAVPAVPADDVGRGARGDGRGASP